MIPFGRARTYDKKDHIFLRMVYHMMPILIAAGMGRHVPCAEHTLARIVNKCRRPREDVNKLILGAMVMPLA